MAKLRVDEVYPKNPLNPILINFQNGYITDNFHSTPCSVFENKENGKKFIATELNALIYAGEEENEALCKTLVLARNRETGKVRLIEVDTANIKPVLKIDSDVSQLQETSNLELSRKFGSKKQKKQMEQREKLKVNIETVTEQMSKVTENVTEATLDLSLYNKNDCDDFYVPPINRTANKIEEVYDINKILTEDEFQQIYSELEEKDFLSDFFPLLKNIVSGKKLSEKNTVLSVYANCLLRLYMTSARDISKKSFLACSYSGMLNEILLKNFTTVTSKKNTRTRPTPYKDKSLCHAIVLVLLINNLKLDLEDLCKDLKLTASNAAMKVKVTGASIVTNANKKVAQLKLPLITKAAFRRKSAKF